MPDTPLTPPRPTIEALEFTQNPPSPYVELGLVSCFSFLRGASDATDLALTAHGLGYDMLGIADHNTLAGIVRLHVATKQVKIRPLIGARLVPLDGPALLAYPTNRAAYGRLSTLLSKGKMAKPDGEWQDKGACDITLADIAAHADGLRLIALPGDNIATFAAGLPRLIRALPGLGHIAASHLYRGDDRARINQLAALAHRHSLALIATNDVLYHAAERRPLQDIMTCIREKTTITRAGYHLAANAERHLKSPADMATLFADWPAAIAQTRIFAESLNFSLDELKYEYPRENIPDDYSPQSWLSHLTWKGAAHRYPDGLPSKVEKSLHHELGMIEKLDVARYFLTVHDVVAFARSLTPPILCQGRGSAANSAVCYVLGITAVDPAHHDLLFERFISEERKEPPDIDVDFEHERREEVIQHIYAKYGRARAGLCATVIHYRPRSAVREVGKVMGLSEDVTAALARTIWGSYGREVGAEHAREAGLNLDDPHLQRTIKLADMMIGMPRHLSQHVGGFILTQTPLIETVPIGNGAMADRSFIEWDKDDIEALGIMKIDVLALGMLTCIRKCFDLIRAHYGRDLELATVPQEDAAVYDMLCRGDSVGTFQVESRAQMNMLPRLKPRTFYDLVIQVAIVRPGPIQGDMVHPYLRRRAGDEAVIFPSPAPPNDPDELRHILKRTLGVPIFQEQAMKLAIDAAQFSSAEANQLRKAMATFRSKGTIGMLQDKMVTRMVQRGYEPEFAQRCFDQIKGFGDYGFPESHAASFALLAYISAWLKCHYPDAFACGLLNSQPMGFYAPAQIVRDLRDHAGAVRAPDVNFSDWNNTLEPTAPGQHALRLGFRQISGMDYDMSARMIAARDTPYSDLKDVQERSGSNVATLRRLAAADGFRSLGLDRRAALWQSRALVQAPNLPLFTQGTARDVGIEPETHLPVMPVSEHVVADYQTLRLSLKSHPMRFLRRSLTAQHYTTCASLSGLHSGARVSLAGLVLVRQRPGTAKGVCFITIEDETGVANLVVWAKIMAAHRRVVMGSRLLVVHGRVQAESGVIHVVAERLEDRTDALNRLAQDPGDPEMTPDSRRPLSPPKHRHPRGAQIIPKSRDFH